MQEDSGNCKSTQPGWPVRPSQFRHHVLSISLHPVRRDAPCCGFITGEPRLPRVFADCIRIPVRGLQTSRCAG